MKAEPSIQRSFRVKREFGLIVGIVFTLLGWLYRGKLTVVAEVNLLLGVVLPKSLVYPNRAWILLAEALAYVSTRIILGFVFFAIVTPIGVVRMFGWDPLHRREVSGPSYWRPYSDRQRVCNGLER
ncbi:MAG: SxtJ family membrane protein [Acidobacteria bacterium]|nr:SxtJ family membrane protein [Acidobacteriota bacterium]